jgi:hypothetical protein
MLVALLDNGRNRILERIIEFNYFLQPDNRDVFIWIKIGT